MYDLRCDVRQLCAPDTPENPPSSAVQRAPRHGQRALTPARTWKGSILPITRCGPLQGRRSQLTQLVRSTKIATAEMTLYMNMIESTTGSAGLR